MIVTRVFAPSTQWPFKSGRFPRAIAMCNGRRCIAGAVPWVAIAIYLAGAGSGGGDVPTFVYWIFGSIFVVFNIFAVNMFLQYRRLGPWKDYVFGEYSYIILSLTAKSLLAWQVFAGTLAP